MSSKSLKMTNNVHFHTARHDTMIFSEFTFTLVDMAQ